MPGLRGFVLTYMKNGAEQVLSALYDAPLLASWRYGLGRTAAFTSDFSGRWSASLLAWDQFPRFAAQIVRWIERPTDSNLLHPRIETAGGTARVSVDAYDSLGAFANGLEIRGILLRPGGERAEIRVPQSGPGLYEASFPADETGDYTLTLSARSGETELPPVTIGTSIAWSEEYRMPAVNTALLDRLASSTGGRVIVSGDDAAGLSALLHREPGASGTGTNAGRLLLLASVLLFFLDIAARRLAAPRETLDRITARLRTLLPRRSTPGLSFDELSGMVTRAHDEERSKLKTRITGLGREGTLDPELAAYLYIARLRSGRAAKEERK
jgi:Ca-activated chloride channel homolog